jgi:hypothetical protein
MAVEAFLKVNDRNTFTTSYTNRQVSLNNMAYPWFNHTQDQRQQTLPAILGAGGKFERTAVINVEGTASQT